MILSEFNFGLRRHTKPNKYTDCFPLQGTLMRSTHTTVTKISFWVSGNILQLRVYYSMQHEQRGPNTAKYCTTMSLKKSLFTLHFCKADILYVPSLGSHFSVLQKYSTWKNIWLNIYLTITSLMVYKVYCTKANFPHRKYCFCVL